jgi:hypothetical protein
MDIDLLSPREALDAFNVFIALGLFAFYFLVEALDSSLTFSLTQHKSIQSAVVTFILYTTLAIEVAAIISNYLYVLPIALGAACGAWAIVEHEKKKRPLKH